MISMTENDGLVIENPARRRVPRPNNPGEYPDPYYIFHDNPQSVGEMLCQLEHYM